MTDYTVSDGQTSSGLTLSAGDTLTVLSGGTASATTVDSGGAETVSSGGVDMSAIVLAGGTQTVDVGGVAASATISGFQDVFGGISATTVVGGRINLEDGGSAVATTVFGELYMLSGASATGTVLTGGALEFINVGATEISGIVDSGASINNEGTTLGVIVNSGGSVLVDEGTIRNTTVNRGGFIEIFQLASAVDTTIIGGAITVESGGLATANVLVGGSETVQSGGSDIGATIEGGGVFTVDSGGFASATVIDSGIFLNAGTAIDAVINNGGSAAGATFVGTIVEAGGILSGGVTSATQVFGTEFVQGLDVGTTIFAGGIQQVLLTGSASDTTVSSGGTQVFNLVGAGIYGSETVFSGGAVVSAVIASSGALLDLKSGAVISGGVTFVEPFLFNAGPISGDSELEVEGTTSPGFTVYGMTPGDKIDLPALPFVSASTISLTAGNLLDINDNGSRGSVQLDPSQNFTNMTFSLSEDATGGTAIGERTVGQFGFNGGVGFSSVNLSFAKESPAKAFAFNVDVFTSLAIGDSLPPLQSGFQAGVIDPGGFVFNGWLVGPIELFGGDYEIIGAVNGSQAPTEIFLGSGNQTVLGAAGDTLVGGSGNQIFNAALNPGGESILGGSGEATIFGGAADTISIGTGSTYVDGSAGDMSIAIGSDGNDLIVGTMATGAAPDTLLGGAANVSIQYLGQGDVVDFAAQTGAAQINATAGNIPVTMGGGPASVYGGTGDTIVLGSVGQYVDGSAGGIAITLGSGGEDTIIGSSVAGDGDTITGGAANLNYNPHIDGGHDLIDLSGSTGAATINAFSAYPTGDFAHVDDTIIAGNGTDSVWGGDGDRIGVGDGATVDGTHLWGHSTTIAGAALGFGSNDSVVATSYDTVAGTFSINSTLPGASSAEVTIGGGAGNFDPASDYLFYQNETATTNAAIVATAQAVDGGNSTLLALPDGSEMTLTGITPLQLQTAFLGGTLFKP